MLPNYLIGDYLRKYIQSIHSALSLQRWCEFHDEDKIQEVAKIQRSMIMTNLMEDISALNGESICYVIEKLDAEISKWTKQFIVENQDRREELKRLLCNVVGFLTKDFESSSQMHLSMKPYIGIEQLQKFLDCKKEQAMNSFRDHWNQGSTELHHELQVKLECEIETIAKKVVEQQTLFLQGPAADEKKLFKEFEQSVFEKLEETKRLTYKLNKTILVRKSEEMMSILKDHHKFSKAEYGRAHFQIFMEITKAVNTLCQSNKGGYDGVAASMDELIFTIQKVFLGVTESDQMREKRSKFEIQKLLADMLLQYATDIEKTVRVHKYLPGYSSGKLEAGHQALSKRLVSSLPAKIRKIDSNEPIESHRYIMLGKIEEYWMSVKEEFNEKRNKFLELDEKAEQKSLKRFQAVGGAPTKVLRDRANICEKQLVLKISHPNISMGVSINGAFEMVETGIPLLVGKSSSGQLVFGKDAMEQCLSHDTPLDHWWITDYLGSFNFQFPKQEISFITGNSKCTAEVSVEFLLGYILKSLKELAEKKHRCNFPTAIITVPIWFCSTHRIQVKDAGKIAGFAEFNLIHVESAAALAYLSLPERVKPLKKAEKKERNYYLVFSEYFGTVSAIVYGIDSEKDQSETLSMFAISFLKQKMNTDPPNLKEASGFADMVWQMCQLWDDSYCYYSPTATIFLSDSPIWLHVLKKVAQSNEWENCVEMCESKVMAALGGKFADVRKPLSEYCQLDLYMNINHKKDMRNMVIYREETGYIDHPTPEIFGVKLKYGERETEFYQESTLETYEEVCVGKLVIGPSVYALQQVRLIFEIDWESIVTLKEVRIVSSSDEDSDNESNEDYYDHCDGRGFGNFYSGKVLTDFTWTTPNLTEEKIENLKQCIESVIGCKAAI